MKHLISSEFKKALSLRFFLLSMALIFLPLIVVIPMINGSYQFFRPLEVHSQLFSSSAIALLFPILLVPLFSGSYANEKNDNFLLYVKPRVNLTDYLFAKGLVNGLVTLIVAFLMIFTPFMFIEYLDPFLHVIQYETNYYEPVSVGTFEFLNEKSVFLYGVFYSLWVAINGALYVTVAYLLSILIKNRFVALSVPFLWWFIMNFVAGVLGFESFSPVYSVFPFLITSQPIWVVFIPFITLIAAIVGLLIFIKLKKKVWIE
ncbi:hypothetical protein [Sporosarcina sp. D27]|uniref:hypothetical protein n=1 Tax=Sporosarcina sp. D27 TaxID=1382305 RepID=UPI00046F2C6D|nr:hypothetical protein [Sporosarcina sp. D27]